MKNIVVAAVGVLAIYTLLANKLPNSIAKFVDDIKNFLYLQHAKYISSKSTGDYDSERETAQIAKQEYEAMINREVYFNIPFYKFLIDEKISYYNARAAAAYNDLNIKKYRANLPFIPDKLIDKYLDSLKLDLNVIATAPDRR